MSNISIVWGTTPKKRNLHDAGAYPHLNTPEHFTADFWLSQEQQKNLEKINDSPLPSDITGYQIIRGAFHGFYTRIRPLMENWGADYAQEYDLLLDRIAEATGWHHVRIDGANAVIKQTPPDSHTWDRWKKNNPSSHLREASKKNWEVYHSYVGDIDSIGEWNDDLFIPANWRKKYEI